MMYHVTPAKNLASIKKHGLTCKIGPRSQKIGEPISAIYLFPTLTYATEAIGTWLGDEFDDDIDLIVLPVKLSENQVEHAENIDYERCSICDIPPNLIDFDHIVNGCVQ